VKENDQADQVATDAEVEEALQRLTVPDLDRLMLYAQFRIWWIGKAACGWNEEDLLQEAFMRTLSGARKWPKNKVKFLKFLLGVIHSISSDMARKLQTEIHDEPLFESELSRQENEKASNQYQVSSASTQDLVAGMDARKIVDMIRDYFRDDPEVLNVMEGLDGELIGPEICEYYDMSLKEFNAARLRLKRGCFKVFPEGKEYV